MDFLVLKKSAFNPEYRVTAKDTGTDKHIAFYENTRRYAFTVKIG